MKFLVVLLSVAIIFGCAIKKVGQNCAAQCECDCTESIGAEGGTE